MASSAPQSRAVVWCMRERGGRAEESRERLSGSVSVSISCVEDQADRQTEQSRRDRLMAIGKNKRAH